MPHNSNPNRRTFIKTSVKGTVVLAAGASFVTSVLGSCSTPKLATGTTNPKFLTGFDQQPLPYGYAALENVIDATTMEIHYTKHAAAYSKNLKEAAQSEGAGTSGNVDTLLHNISKYSSKLRNNAGGHYNHEMFWKSMRPKQVDNKPSGNLLTAIEKQFGSFGEFKKQFSDAGKNRFGSGWAWLYIDKDHTLKIGSTPNQDNPLMDVSEIHGFPVLGLDVWEHAYYLKYQNKRADYIENWWNVVNWDYAGSRFAG